MRRRVVSFCVALLFTICFITSGRTYASGIWTVDDNVDPWVDLEMLEGGGDASAPSAQVDSAEDNPVEDALDDDFPESGFFGYSAVLESGEVVENGVAEGMSLFAVNSGFNGRWLGSPSFYGQWKFVSSSMPNPASGGGAVSGTSFGVFSGSSTTPWEFVAFHNPSGTQVAPDFGIDNLQVSVYAWTNSTQQSVFISFSDMADSDVEEVSLMGSFSLNLRVLTGSSVVKYYYPYSAALIAYVEGSDIPITLSSCQISSSTVNMPSDPIPINKHIREIGIRVIISDLGTNSSSNVSNTTLKGTSAWPLISWQLYASPGSSFSVDFDGSQSEGDITNGLLSGLIEIVTGIYNAVVGLPSQIGNIISDLGNILSSLTELPGKLWDLISEGLQSLFIPTDEQLQELSENYDGLWESKLGFVYQMFSFVVDTFSGLKGVLSAADNYIFHFPGISFPMNGQMLEIIPAQDVSLDNAVMDVLRPVLGTIVTIVSVLSVTSLGFDMVVAILSGKSYSQFIGEKRGDLDI